jgi:hypothetical protein
MNVTEQQRIIARIDHNNKPFWVTRNESRIALQRNPSAVDIEI